MKAVGGSNVKESSEFKQSSNKSGTVHASEQRASVLVAALARAMVVAVVRDGPCLLAALWGCLAGLHDDGDVGAAAGLAVGRELDGGVLDAQAAAVLRRLLQDRDAAGPRRQVQVHRQQGDARRERPHMQVMHLLHALDLQEQQDCELATQQDTLSLNSRNVHMPQAQATILKMFTH